MKLDLLWTQMAFALVGGIAAEFLHWYMLSRKQEGVGAYLPKPGYWLFSLGMVLLGALMPLLYLSGDASALLCFHLGATAPIALQKLVDAAPTVVARQGALTLGARPSFRTFVRW